MLTQVFSKDFPPSATPQEGELYKVLHIYGRTFRILYGYYEEKERENPLIEPMPIYPDFWKYPQYTPEGAPFVTKMQDPCGHYIAKRPGFCECAECAYYSHGEDLIGVCVCPANRKEPTGQDSP